MAPNVYLQASRRSQKGCVSGRLGRPDWSHKTMSTNDSESQESIAPQPQNRLERIHDPRRETIAMSDTIDVRDADDEAKEDLQTIAREYEKSFRKRAERILGD